MPRCAINLGLPRWINLIAKNLKQTGLLTNKYSFVADMFPSFWMYADFTPLPQGHRGITVACPALIMLIT